MSFDAFVSYATPDRAITMALVDDLEARGLTCWIAPRDVPGGSKYAEVILNALAESQVFLLVFSENSNASEHVQREVERALNGSKKIVPVRIADVLPSGAMDYYLATLHWIDAFGAAREGSFDVTAQALASLLGKKLKTAVISEPDVQSVTGSSIETRAGKTVEAVISHGPPAKSSSAAVAGGAAKKAGGRTGLIVAVIAVAIVGLGLTFWKTIDYWQGDDKAKDKAKDTAETEANPKHSSPVEPPAEPIEKTGGMATTTAKPAADGSTETAPSKAPKQPVLAEKGDAPTPTTVDATTSPMATEPVSVAVPVKIEVPPINLAGSETVLMPKQESVVATDPVTAAVEAAGKSWAAGDRQAARDFFEPVLALTSTEDEVIRDRLGKDGIALVRSMVVAAAEEADGGEWQDFQSIDAWRGLVDFSERLAINDLAAQRQRFDQAWAIAQAESQWQARQLDAAAQSLAEIATRGEVVMARLNADGDALGLRLKTLLDEVSTAAGEGRLGTMQVLADRWQPVLQLAASAGKSRAIGVLARIAWDTGDAAQAALNLANFEKLTRGAEALDPTVEDLLGEVIRAAEADPKKIQGRQWESALELARAHEMRGSLNVLADLIHARNPEEAAPLYRQMYAKTQTEGSLRNRIGFCLQMLKRYDLGDEASFYRSQLDEAFETTLEAMDQPSSGGELIEEIPEIRDAAEAGIAPAQYIMGDLLSAGKGVKKDAVQAFEFYQKAAASNYARAKYAVGECYRDGRGVPANRDEALRIWRTMSEDEAAEVPQVLLNLASVSSSDEEREQLYVQARRYYEVKVNAGQVAKYGSGLGQMLVSGWGGEAEAKRGYQLLEASAEKGSSHGAFLAGLLLVGEVEPFIGMRAAAGIERDVTKGTELIKTAARDGYPNALSWCEGNGVAVDQ